MKKLAGDGWRVVRSGGTRLFVAGCGVLRCDVVSLGKWFATFRRNLAPLASVIFHGEWLTDHQRRRRHYNASKRREPLTQ